MESNVDIILSGIVHSFRQDRMELAESLLPRKWPLNNPERAAIWEYLRRSKTISKPGTEYPLASNAWASIPFQYITDEEWVAALYAEAAPEDPEALERPDLLEGSRLKARDAADAILASGPVAKFEDGCFYEFRGGAWKKNKNVVASRIATLLGNRFLPSHVNTVEKYIETTHPTISIVPVLGYINYKNGMLRLEDRELVPHDLKYNSTFQLNCSYDPTAGCPEWFKFLDSVLPAKNDQERLQEMVGYLLTPGNPLEAAFLWTGGGANGKSTALNIIMEILGRENLSHESLDVLLDPNNNKFRVAELFGKSANICGDIGSRYAKRTEQFKKLVSEDPMVGEMKGKDAFHFTFWGKLLFSCNEFSASADTSYGYKRRWQVLPWNVKIEDSQRVLEYWKLFIPEKDGIAAWALEGLYRLRDTKTFTSTETSRAAFKEFEETMDSVAAFKSNCVENVTSSAQSSPRSMYWPAYLQFCEENLIRPIAKFKFLKRLENLGMVPVQGDGGTVKFRHYKLKYSTDIEDITEEISNASDQ